jgi:hypothetical protein
MSRNKKVDRPGNKAGRNDSFFPPTIKQKPQQVRVFRYVTSEDVTNEPVTRKCMLSLILAGDVPNTGPQYIATIISAIRLDRICMWSIPQAPELFSNIALEWQDTRGSAVLLNDQGSPTRPAHITSSPPKDSTAGMWSGLSTTYYNEPLFYLSAPAGTVIDLHVTYVLADGTAGYSECLRRECTGFSGQTVVGYPCLDSYSIGGGVGVKRIRPSILTYINVTV